LNGISWAKYLFEKFDEQGIAEAITRKYIHFGGRCTLGARNGPM